MKKTDQEKKNLTCKHSNVNSATLTVQNSYTDINNTTTLHSNLYARKRSVLLLTVILAAERALVHPRYLAGLLVEIFKCITKIAVHSYAFLLWHVQSHNHSLSHGHSYEPKLLEEHTYARCYELSYDTLVHSPTDRCTDINTAKGIQKHN